MEREHPPHRWKSLVECPHRRSERRDITEKNWTTHCDFGESETKTLQYPIHL